MDKQDILDITDNRSDKNSRLSLSHFWISLIVFTVIVVLSTVFYYSKMSDGLIISTLSLGFTVSSLLGFIYTVKSFVAKENKNRIQLMGMIGNIVFFGLVLYFTFTLMYDFNTMF